jgi:aspartyl-tRNA synthetase
MDASCAHLTQPPQCAYRTHGCGVLRAQNAGTEVALAGWVHIKRDHGQLLFVDLRDESGLTQCVIERTEGEMFAVLDRTTLESVVRIKGSVVLRSEGTRNPGLATGDVEVVVTSVEMLSACVTAPLPIQVNSDEPFPEDTRLKWRFLDLRRAGPHARIHLRSQVISSLRRRMEHAGFQEIQTPILTARSPEGARDFLVPSRLCPGEFFALPQAPQQFKQLLMASGFDRYFQIAPCFRDEAARSDRSPGEFYQLDFEMAFVDQDDVFAAIEPILHGVFTEFSSGKAITEPPFPRITYADALSRYGTDKPDLRNPILIQDVSDIFAGGTFTRFAEAVARGHVVRALRGYGAAGRSRKFFDDLQKTMQQEGALGLAYVALSETLDMGALAQGTIPEGNLKGPLAKFIDAPTLRQLIQITGAEPGDAVFFVCDAPAHATRLAGRLRTHLGTQLEVIEKNAFRFCWVVDFPMFERDEATGAIVFSHNPFSMPQGGLEALNTQDPLDIKAWQYDIVCNGVELSSGAIRNHLPEVMYRAFEIAGHSRSVVDQEFGGMIRAFQCGVPPHGGSAPGIDRIVMLLADALNLREVVAFPMSQNGRDLLMNAPTPVPDACLAELGLGLRPRTDR